MHGRAWRARHLLKTKPEIISRHSVAKTSIKNENWNHVELIILRFLRLLLLALLDLRELQYVHHCEDLH